MRRADRLFEIIQALRGAKLPMTAAALAAELDVAARTIYRDIAALQARRVPIAGERGIGYILRPGFELPPLAFTVEEVEAITVALGLLPRTGDAGLRAAARRVEGKIAAVLPAGPAAGLRGDSLIVSGPGVPVPAVLDLGEVRAAIREERKLELVYGDELGAVTERTILPVALVYYVEVAIVAAWCELRAAFRHFRADRVRACRASGEEFAGRGEGLRQAWLKERQAG